MVRITNYLKRIDTKKLATIIIVVVFVVLTILSFTRNATKDENLYLRETMVISELLKNGQWIGDYGVGLHGFLFKLPVAIVFMITGPSVHIATLFNLVIAFFAAIFLFKILREHFKFNGWALAGLIIFITSLYFIRTTPTYLRDMPALFITNVFIYYFLKGKSNWFLGILLLLMFDAKEHVFFTIAFGYGIWIILNGILSKQTIIDKVKYIVFEGFKAFFPVALWLVLMFTTSLVPVNMFNASILGLVDDGFRWTKNQFGQLATINRSVDEEVRVTKQIFQITPNFIKEIGNPPILKALSGELGNSSLTVIDKIISLINTTLRYVGKIAYPATFSFNSIPKVIVLPSLVASVVMFFHWFKNWKKNNLKAMLPIMLWGFLLLYILRSSHGRYLLAITPLIVLFFIIFVRNILYSTKVSKWTLILTGIYIFIGLLFEDKYVFLKALFEYTLFGCLVLILYLNVRKSNLNQLAMLIFVVVLGTLTMGTSLRYFVMAGQLGEYIKWGQSHEVAKVVNEFDRDEIVLLNDVGWDHLPMVYRYDMSLSPTWKWQMKEGIPKRDLVKYAGEPNTYVETFSDVGTLKRMVLANDVDRIGVVRSDIDGIEFPMQRLIPLLERRKWIKEEKQVKLKNATLFIFDIIK